MSTSKHIAEGVLMSSAAQINLNDGKITGIDTTLISANGDAASKLYVDNAVQGLQLHPSVRAATSVAGTLASDFENGDIAGGVTLATGNRILIKNQANAIENGIYVVNASGAPTRATDFAVGAHVKNAFCFVEEGTNADTGWVCSNNAGTDVVGTDELAFVQFSSAGVITAGNGLEQSGNIISVKAYNGIEVSASGTAVKLDTDSGLAVGAGGLKVNSSIAGDGLTLTTGVLAVGAGSGISVAADTVSLGSLSADWDAGSYEIRALTFESDVVTGTAPFTVASQTVVTNLNADKLDGSDATAFLAVAGDTMEGDLNMGAFDITNADTISTLSNGLLTLAPNGTGYTVTTKDIRIDNASAGVVLKDTNGTYWRVTISTLGVLTATSL